MAEMDSNIKASLAEENAIKAVVVDTVTDTVLDDAEQTSEALG